jgi:hypothetical protein
MTHVNNLQKFLGMCRYFAAYILFYAFIVVLMFALLRKAVKFE